MSSDLLFSLFGYSFLLATGVLWIAVDAETAYVFDVFGKSFDYVWRHSGKRWKFTAMYGWRLLAVVALITSCAYMGWRLVNAASLGRVAAPMLFAVLAGIPLCLLPWIGIASRIRFQRTLRNAAKVLTPVAQGVADAPDVSAVLDRAQYLADPGWWAWHPKSADEWPVVAPVAYLRSPPPSAMIFPIDFETFLGWRAQGQLPPVGSLLPFRGPGETAFLLKGVWPLRGMPDWFVIQAEIQLDDEIAPGAIS